MTTKRLTKEEVEKIIAARHAKRRRARAELMQRLIDEAKQAMHGQQGRDLVPDESAELALVETIIAEYVDATDEASFAELRELLQRCAIDPRLVMAAAQRWA
jgi:hypothetical protein